MNRRQFLARAALALGGALLAPLAKSVAAATPVPEPAARWVKAFDPADIERAFAEPVEPWDFPTTVRDGTTVDNFIEGDWGPTTTGVRVVAWGNTIHIPRYENFTTRPRSGDFTTDYWDGTAWREVGD